MTPPDTLSRCEAVVTPAPTGVQLRLECETVGLAPYRAHGTDSRPRSIRVCPRVVPKGRADRPLNWQAPYARARAEPASSLVPHALVRIASSLKIRAFWAPKPLFIWAQLRGSTFAVCLCVPNPRTAHALYSDLLTRITTSDRF